MITDPDYLLIYRETFDGMVRVPTILDQLQLDTKRFFLNVAIDANRTDVITVILDCFEIPKENMTLKERITYYELMCKDT